jgi:hypothetical protein
VIGPPVGNVVEMEGGAVARQAASRKWTHHQQPARAGGKAVASIQLSGAQVPPTASRLRRSAAGWLHPVCHHPAAGFCRLPDGGPQACKVEVVHARPYNEAHKSVGDSDSLFSAGEKLS